MATFRQHLLTTAAAVTLVMGGAAGTTLLLTDSAATQSAATCAANPCAAKKPDACNPCAAKAACGACNPCAVTKTSACNPCTAKAACGACNPCAASACNPCNPCAAGGGFATECYVPRLQQAALCNPCAAKPASACGACNPCAAKAACGACNPCAAKSASACGACNPCAAKNPCASANPCAAAACNPCNPCGAGSAAADPEDLNLGPQEVTALYDCLKSELAASYKGGGHWAVNQWENFVHFSKYPYPSATHGNRFVVNYTNEIGAEAYAQYGDVNPVPPGTTSAKASFVVDANGQASLGPLFIMEKMTRGFNAATADWRYAMVMPGGTTVGLTGGAGSDAVTFCHECHAGAEDADFLFFLPEEVRAR
jgi:hypothetical protein